MDIRESPFIKNLPHIIGIAILILVLLFVLVNFGYLRCCDVPGFCDIYYGIKGYPKIAIVFGDDGIGDPEALRDVIIQRKHQFPDMIPIENLVSTGLLDKYALVIVEHARTIQTPTFYVFRDYVQKGGKLAWVGDAGTGLVKGKDYVCEKIAFSYLPAMNSSMLLQNGTHVAAGVQCAPDWVEDKPDIPEDLKGGVCGSSFGEIVLNYVKAKDEINQSLKTAGMTLCPTEKQPFRMEGGEKEQKCVDYLKSKYGIKESDMVGKSAMYAIEINRLCAYGPEFPYGFSNWKRGPSTTLTGSSLEPIDLGAAVLGLDYVSSEYAGSDETVNLFLQPTDVSHRLVRGYEARTKWFGTAQFSIADISRYTLRTASVMNLMFGNKVLPAVAVSSPVGPLLTKTGLVVYYAFPPEIGATVEPTGGTTTQPVMTGKVVKVNTEEPSYDVGLAEIRPGGSEEDFTTDWSWKDSKFTTLISPAGEEYAVGAVELNGYEWQKEAAPKEARGMGLNLIDNLIDFTLCK